jgi:ATP-binding cassette subfamily C protein LapB
MNERSQTVSVKNPVGDLLERVRAEAPNLAASNTSAALEQAGSRINDPLAAVICEVAAHYGRPVAEEVLVAGLALVDGRLPREHMPDAAARAGFVCEPSNARVRDLKDHDLPVVIFGRDGELQVLWKIERNRFGKATRAVVTTPESHRSPIEVGAQDLKEMSPRETVKLRPFTVPRDREDGAQTKRESNWFFAAFRESRRIYAEAILATVVINVLALAMPLFSMNVYDRVLPNAAEATLWALAIGVLLAIAFDFLIRTLRAHFVDAASRRADVRLAALIHSRLVGARLSMRPAAAGVRANTVREFETLREFLNSATLAAFGDLPFLVLFIAVIWIVAGPLAFIVAASIPIILLFGWLTQRALHRLVFDSFRETAQKNAVVVETLVGLEAIKAAGAESWAAQNWERSVAEHVRTGLKIRRTSNLGQHVVHATQMLVQVAVVVGGFYLVSAGQITMGALIAATILSGRALSPLAQVAMLLSRFNQARIAYACLNDMVTAPQERPTGATLLAKRRYDGEVAFEKVTFQYAPEDPPALADFDLRIAPGERVALLGGIGSGKTTALKLVHGLYLPTSGRVLVDGISVSQIEPSLLRANVGLLLQGGELFHGTIRENIMLSDSGASEDAVLQAARTAGALEWIGRMPQGFDTQLRERGHGLSGGQRQGIALARSLLRKPRILLLDEPTSEMDGRTERIVIQRLMAALAGRTLLLVTHRPVLLDLVDRIVVVENGRKIEDGPKEYVLDKLRTIAAARGPQEANSPTRTGTAEAP